MQIPKNLLRVIFMLSTIVAVTDCCSSRILFLKEQTFNVIQQHKMQQYQSDDQHQPMNEKFEQHVYNSNTGSSDKIFNKNHTNVNVDDESPSGDEQTNADGLSTAENSAHLDRPPPAGDGYADMPFEEPQSPSQFIADPAVREQLGDNKGYQLFDIYYTIMRDVLSFACTGQFLTEFCLNGGRCFRYPVGNHSFFSCECADGYVGERCESKSVNGVIVPTPGLDAKPPKILTARVVFSFPMLIFLSVTYLFFGMAIVFKCQPSFRHKNAPTHTSRAAGLLFS
ncbi:protein gurken [Stomoxys calcitrans]|uniref:EGF-like domain-containing protein n=1 Tax=Stomoxys calcitrans TaxID=35570 RepID=A0A1I8NSI5_STOCA|nr:protein gurken [Stomoxys calcitrans]